MCRLLCLSCVNVIEPSLLFLMLVRYLDRDGFISKSVSYYLRSGALRISELDIGHFGVRHVSSLFVVDAAND